MVPAWCNFKSFNLVVQNWKSIQLIQTNAFGIKQPGVNQAFFPVPLFPLEVLACGGNWGSLGGLASREVAPTGVPVTLA